AFNPLLTRQQCFSTGTLVLMLYALLWEAGNPVDLPDKRIGFYNFCLWNETAGRLQCLEYEHLQMMGISLPGIVIARVCVYACLVFSIFYPIFVAHVKCTEQTEGWKVIIVILIIKTIILSGGLGIFLFQTTHWAKHTPRVKPLLLRRPCPLRLAVKKMQELLIT
uniref:Transmembrane protein 140 n=1 Tax=Strix occidentalis caurina TaxID=311401 RepID=A0A8D0FK68_STROC